VTIAHKLLISVWHVLTEKVADRFTGPEMIANRFMNYAYKVRVRNLPNKQTAAAFTREQLDLLSLCQDLQKIRRGSKSIQLPPSKLIPKE
jgi:hypothetical protein